jgi:hypothetical protein
MHERRPCMPGERMADAVYVENEKHRKWKLDFFFGYFITLIKAKICVYVLFYYPHIEIGKRASFFFVSGYYFSLTICWQALRK